ncbi:ParB/RepB/Spo0J family partition protein [Actomonas aquatica]|uniref:ParB/RepB/Spo0J family partition protein n=1 Tax=Actomonas aquatica TaxID=2866162 RepID=A0ABZ1C9Y1_9BACT|nr:ParB/RepB/Spo0J family partition protein [Opitutus sp. WL0086]WRQ88202.1 ParB/RepB/Spo0J family partition protein [Opitutus sp. WL0086]
MASSKSRLGRGLGGLIAAAAPAKSPTAQAAAKAVGNLKDGKGGKAAAAAATTEPPATPGFEEIAVTHIEPSPYQARREIQAEHLNELAESIKSEGLLQPIVVRKIKDKQFELIAGERRWRAYQVLKLKTIPARVVEASNASAAALGLIENLQREGLNPIEEAYGYASLIRDFDLTQEQASDRVGKSRASVANTLRLLSLDAELQGYVAKSILSFGHAKVLLGIEAPAERAILARRVIEDGLSVRATEKLVQDKKSGSASSSKKAAKKGGTAAEVAAINGIEKKLTSHLGARVALKHTPKKGQIVIQYAGNDDLARILEKLGVEA